MAIKHSLSVNPLSTRMAVCLLVQIMFVVSSSSWAGVNDAYEHIYETMDLFHESFHVYTDLSAAGNHFVTLGSTASAGDLDKVEINPGFTGN